MWRQWSPGSPSESTYTGAWWPRVGMGISIHQAVCMVNGCTDGGGRLVDTKGTRVVAAKLVHHLPHAQSAAAIMAVNNDEPLA